MILLILLFLAICVIASLPVMLLWNWLMPTIFGLTTINIWQAGGLILLCNLLFKPDIYMSNTPKNDEK